MSTMASRRRSCRSRGAGHSATVTGTSFMASPEPTPRKTRPGVSTASVATACATIPGRERSAGADLPRGGLPAEGQHASHPRRRPRAARVHGCHTRRIGPLTVWPVTGLPEVRAGDDLAGLIARALGADPLRDRDVDVVARKIVSKAE